jgi:hypothetical protein
MTTVITKFMFGIDLALKQFVKSLGQSSRKWKRVFAFYSIHGVR